MHNKIHRRKFLNLHQVCTKSAPTLSVECNRPVTTATMMFLMLMMIVSLVSGSVLNGFEAPGTLPIRVVLIPSCGPEPGGLRALEQTAESLRNVVYNDGQHVYDVFNGPYPDPIHCRMEKWMPVIETNIVPGNTIIAGASTGALAVMRALENHRFLVSILLSSTRSAGGNPSEVASHWYPDHAGPWQYEAMSENAQNEIYFFGGDNDPYCLIDDQLYIHSHVSGSTFIRFPLLEREQAHLEDVPQAFDIIVNKTARWFPPSVDGVVLPSLLPVSGIGVLGEQIVTVNEHGTVSALLLMDSGRHRQHQIRRAGEKLQALKRMIES